ncbi:hypothetical protein YTPLAS18_16140 [Nitrospira sp.]|nr:hypothetical protein YTPLAS18_16140 [Nitrospira sp.]
MKLLVARFCTGCGKICDELAKDQHGQGWTDAHVLLAKYGFRWTDLELRQTYCDDCERVIQAGSGTKYVQLAR